MADEQVQDANASETEAPALTEVEQLAKEMGWDPNYQPAAGKQARTAQDWIKSTNARNKTLTRQIEGMQGQVERIVAATDKQVRREVERRAQEIEQRFAEAVDAKDKTGAAKAAQEMRDLEAEQADPAPKGSDPVAKFQAENPWYGTDDEATAYAAAQSSVLAKRGITDPEKQLAGVAAAVRKRFPELFDDGAANDGEEAKPVVRQPMLNPPGRPGQQRRAQDFGSMPDVARSAANRFYEAAKMRGTAPDRKAFEAQYAKDYFAEQVA